MQTVLITGITGLVGKHLMYRVLQSADFKVIGQYHTPRDLTEFETLHVEMRQADICNPKEIQGLSASCDIIVHCAARVIDYGSKKDFYLAHYAATRWLLEDALKNHAKHFIYISSFGIATYIDRSQGLPNEETPLIKSGVYYDDAKIDTEEYLKSFCVRHRIKYTIIRPAAVIGPESVWVKEPLKRASSCMGVKLIDQGKWDACLIDADNLADGIFRTLTYPIAENQAYYFMDEYGVTWKEYLTDLLSIKGLHTKGNISKKTALLIAHFMEFAFPLVGLKPILGIKAVMATGSDRRVSVDKARKELEWQSTVSYADAMNKISNSLRNQSSD